MFSHKDFERFELPKGYLMRAKYYWVPFSWDLARPSTTSFVRCVYRLFL